MEGAGRLRHGWMRARGEQEFHVSRSRFQALETLDPESLKLETEILGLWVPRPNGGRAHLDTAPATNGAATSSLPSHALSQGDEDVATPFLFSYGGSVEMRPPSIRIRI